MEPMLLETYLKQLRLPTFVRNYRKMAAEVAQANLGYDHFLLALAEYELADFDFSCRPQLNKPQILDLARGEYIPKAEPILMLGNPGLGKTHLATALALAACRQGYRVRFYTAAGLVNDLLQAQDEHRLPRVLTAALKQHLIVLDELGFIPFSPPGAHLLFQFCSSLYERVALIVTTNLRFADWTQVFGDERLTAALLDRLTYRPHIVEFVGESFRFRQRLRRETQKHKG